MQRSDRSAWSEPADPDEVARRAGGRRRYNQTRQIAAALRRLQVSRLMRAYPPYTYGSCSKMAALLGVHKATISRDVQRILGAHAQHGGDWWLHI